MFKYRVKIPPKSRRLKIPNGRIQIQVRREVGQDSPTETQSKANWKDEPEGRRDGFSIDRMMVTSPSSPSSPSGHSFYKLGL